MSVLVTGGAGYIGSIVAQQLIRSGRSVVIYDNLSHGYRAAVPRQAEFIHGDIADTEKLDSVLSGFKIEAAMHFAALIESGESMQKPALYFRNNSANTVILLEALLRRGIRKFVFSSTAAVYGNPEDIPVAEDAPLRPTSVYGESKLIVERILNWLHQTQRLRYASLRYFNAAGAEGESGEAHQPESHLIPLVLQVALGLRESISIYGTDYPTADGTCVRDYIHVSDLAAAHLLVLQALESTGKLIYNLGNGKGFSVHEVIETARRVTGHPIPAKETERRAGDPAVLVASSEKIQKELGWQPRHPDLVAIIQSAWDWQQKHPRGYESAQAGQAK